MNEYNAEVEVEWKFIMLHSLSRYLSISECPTSDSLGVLDVNLGSNWETSVASDLLLKEGMCGGGYRFSSTILQSTEEKKRCAFTASAPEVPSRFSTPRRSSFLMTT